MLIGKKVKLAENLLKIEARGSTKDVNERATHDIKTMIAEAIKNRDELEAERASRLKDVESLAQEVEEPLVEEVVESLAEEVEESFAEKVDLNRVNDIQLSPLWIAVRDGHLNDVENLAKNVDLKQVNDYGHNLVFWAAMFGRTEIVEFLAGEKVNLDQADDEGRTPLYIAAWYGRTEIVKFLIKNKVKLEKKLYFKIAAYEQMKEEIKTIIAGALKE
jgi:ankyrin repeat protein